MGSLSAALVAGALASVPASASVDLPGADPSARAADANRAPSCWGSVWWSAKDKLNVRYWKVSPKNQWRVDDHNTSRKKLGFSPRAFVYMGAAGDPSVSLSTYYAISARRAVVSIDTKTYTNGDVIHVTKKRIGRLEGSAEPMSGMFDLYLVGKGGRVTYAHDMNTPNKRVRVRGLRLRDYRFGTVAYVSTKKYGPVNVMYAVRGSRLVRVVLKGNKVVRAPRVVSRSGWRHAKGVTARTCGNASTLSVVRIEKGGKARGFLQHKAVAQRPAKLGKGVRLTGSYAGHGFGT